MHVVVIGGTGHIGTYLVPRLVEAGHSVTVVSRGLRRPYTPHPAFDRVTFVVLDRDAAEATGVFGAHIAALRGDAVIDLTCFNETSAKHIVAGLRGTGARLLHCGTIWTHGARPKKAPPSLESDPRDPFGDYGIQKHAAEAYLLSSEALRNVACTVLSPGHIVGPGWPCVNPAGNFDVSVFDALLRGAPLALPDDGSATVHHVHADDVAAAFMLALEKWDAAAGESFHVVSSAPLELATFAKEFAARMGAPPPALTFMPFEEWRNTVTAKNAEATCTFPFPLQSSS
jgi:nucleoside-diphosphate-sugar epimerase